MKLQAASLVLLSASLLPAQTPEPAQADVTFRSDVNLARVDVQVIDRDNRAVRGLKITDFVLRENGRVREIRNFAHEQMPVDVLLLLDVSRSMKPHVQKMAAAAHEALAVLGPDDRVGLMVFDRAARVRLKFAANREEVTKEFDRLLKQEKFSGGTDITLGLEEAARYVRRDARRDARRAIVIMTDDRTELDRDDEGVERQLAEADCVLSALIAPDAMASQGYGNPGGGRGGGMGRPRISIGLPYPGGGGYPGGGSRYPGGRGGGYPQDPQQDPRQYPQGRGSGSRTHSAGTSEIARESGGDSMSVEDAYAFRDTLERIRQRYALHFLVPPGAQAGQSRNLEILLAADATRRYPSSEVRYRHSYRPTVTVPALPGQEAEPVISEAAPVTPARSADTGWGSATTEVPRPVRRRTSTGDGSSSRGPNPNVGAPSDTPAQATPAPAAPAATPASSSGGWRKATESDTTPTPVPADPKKKQ